MECGQSWKEGVGVSLIEQSVIAQKQERKSVLRDMAERNKIEPEAFEQVMRATVMPKDATKEELAMFLMVARDYDLNPLTKEIYAFPKKGGGIQPIVSVDGWIKLANVNPMFDGMEFEEHFDAGSLVAITARIYRKDRRHPTKVTEYLSECAGNSDVWKRWPARMLRHKAAIQCIRYAFGFAGIMDEDEYDRMMQVEQTLSIAQQRPQETRTPRLVARVASAKDAIESADVSESVSSDGE